MDSSVNVTKSSGVSRGVALANLIMMLVLLVFFFVFVTKPLFYVTQSYCGGIYTNEEVQEICIEESRDLEAHEEANLGTQIVVSVGILLVSFALLNAWFCFMRLYKIGIKSPVRNAVGSFVFSFLVMGPFTVLKILLDKATVVISEKFTPEELDMFNVYDAIYILGIVAVMVGVVNIFTAFSAKKAIR